MKIKIVNLNENYKIIKSNLKKSFDELFKKQSFILGKEVETLEQNLSKFLKVKYSLGVSSGTDALIVALMACGIKKNDEVIIPDMTWISTASSIMILGAKPVVADVNLSDGTINLNSLKKRINRKTRAIISVGLYGNLPDLKNLKDIAIKNNLHLINDGAQSFGSKYKNSYCHKYTSISCTSFFPAKVLGSFGDAGACFTNNKKLYNKMKIIRSHGQSFKSHSIVLGLNARIDTLQACVVNEKLKIISKEISRRKQISKIYNKYLKKIKSIDVLEPNKFTSYNGSSYVILVNKRDNLQNFLKSKGIQTANLYNYSITQQPTFKKFKDKDMINSKILAKKNICLPIHPYLSNKDVMFIVNTIKNYFN